jgi:hypothetical protein
MSFESKKGLNEENVFFLVFCNLEKVFFSCSFFVTPLSIEFKDDCK